MAASAAKVLVFRFPLSSSFPFLMPRLIRGGIIGHVGLAASAPTRTAGRLPGADLNRTSLPIVPLNEVWVDTKMEFKEERKTQRRKKSRENGHLAKEAQHLGVPTLVFW